MADEAQHNGSEASGSAASAAGRSLSREDSPPARPETTTWPRWTLGVSAPIAFLGSLLLLVTDGLAGILNNLGGPQSVYTWLDVAAVGHGVLAVASAALFVVGFLNPRRRRAAVLTTWAILPVGIGWLLLCVRIGNG